MKEQDKVKKISPATFYVVTTPPGQSDTERFDNLRKQYREMLTAQEARLRESEKLVDAAYG